MAGGGKMVTLRSSDGQEFEAKADTMAAASAMIRNVLEDDCAAGRIPLPAVSGSILARVIEFCNRHYADVVPGVAGAEDPFSSVGENPALERFDADFIGGVDQDTLFDLMLAANYLDVQKLLDLTCKTVADQMKGKTPEQMREHFHIVNDYTEEQEAAARQEVSSAFK